MRKPLLSLLALALVASACSTFGEQPAATVDGVEISADDVKADIDAVTTNQEYRESIEAQYGEIEGDGTFDAAFAAQLLTLRIYIELLDQHLEDEGIEIPADLVDQVEEQVRSSLEGQNGNIYDDFPADYQETVIHQQAVIAVIEDQVRAQIGEDPEAFYEANPDAFAEVCVAHALVALQGGRSPEEAEEQAAELRASIETGASTFEEVATTESDDAAAAEAGGVLGCGSRQQLQLDPTLEEVAFSLDEDELSEPVVTQFGAHLILVTERRIPSYDEIGDAEAMAVLQDSLSRGFNEYVLDVICGTDVDVSTRYGTWTSASCREVVPMLPRVEPPDGPIGAEPEAPSLLGE